MNVSDDFNRERLGIEAGFSLAVRRLARALDKSSNGETNWRALRCDNGSEYISHKLLK